MILYRIFIADWDPADKQTWIFQKGYQDFSNKELYITSFYFTVTTILTVGYGDITAISMAEKCYCVFLMLIGVVAFSFVTGALSSIIANMDSKEASLKEKISTLNELKEEYDMDLNLFNKLARTIKYDHKKKTRDLESFLDELPHKLRTELAMLIHHQVYSRIYFFKDKETNFLSWVSTIIKTINFEEKDYIYKEGEEASEIYFIKKGRICKVLPRFNNKLYKKYTSGMHFGHIDLA